ncbi:MAG: hypothetical protein IPJ88_09880 [Myxococcales bacterium]|nr:MAG: hypothetical protein IPJ88_09880 [Myxococcales bacterium]
MIKSPRNFSWLSLSLLLIGCAQGAEINPSLSPDASDSPQDLAFLNDGGTGLAVDVLDCDPGFSFAPTPPETSKINKVTYESKVRGYTYVSYVFEGLGSVVAENLVVETPKETGDRWRWTWDVTFAEGGLGTIYFKASEIDEGDRPSCQFRVTANGPAPDVVPPFDDPMCAESCPVVGTNLAGPTQFPPDGWSGDWITLDSAGNCEGGHCRIWCPYDPAPGNHHTEACWLSWEQRFMNYEDACRSYCNNNTEGVWSETGHYCGPQ